MIGKAHFIHEHICYMTYPTSNMVGGGAGYRIENFGGLLENFLHSLCYYVVVYYTNLVVIMLRKCLWVPPANNCTVVQNEKVKNEGKNYR